MKQDIEELTQELKKFRLAIQQLGQSSPLIERCTMKQLLYEVKQVVSTLDNIAKAIATDQIYS